MQSAHTYRSNTHSRWGRRLLGLCLAVLVVCSGAQPASGQAFRPDDPLWADPDCLDMPAPVPWDPSAYMDFVKNTFMQPGEHEGPAVNVNTLGEVPNSSWYTNRHYWHPMTVEALQRGPDTVGGPSLEVPWKVISVKEEGKSVGMQIVDGRGERYLLKFDPEGYPEISTAAEVIATKLLYALGYHVPENYITHFSMDQLEPDREEGVSRHDIRQVLRQVPIAEGGGFRALASLFVEGEELLGPFLYHGTRPDDGNDIFPHEARRELRGLRVIAAWLQHDDARSMNSLDVLVRKDGRQYVQHYLIDFGSTLGGGPVGVKDRWAGYEYALDFWPAFLRTWSLGFLGSGWVDITYPGYPSIGRFEAEHFDPQTWKPQYPNPAFQRMDPHDAFWAARQVMNFSNEALRAIVATGAYTDAEAEDYLAEVLMQRRDKIGVAYLGLGGGLDRFQVEGDSLRFEDLLAHHGLAPEDRAREVRWHVFDHAAGQRGAALAETISAAEALAVPPSEADFLMVEIRTPDYGSTQVYLRRSGLGQAPQVQCAWGDAAPLPPDPAAAYEVVGLRRVPADDAPQETARRAPQQRELQF